MGEYADELIFNGFSDMGASDYCEQIPFVINPFYRKPRKAKYEYKKIVRQTDKAWLIEFSGGAKKWLPKSKCDIDKKFIYIPEWLERRIIMIELRNELRRGYI